jgi:hypothetical protein
LRTRNNTQELYEELIVRVCGCSKTDSSIGALIKDVGSWFNTYRYKLHTNLTQLAKEYIALNERYALVIH